MRLDSGLVSPVERVGFRLYWMKKTRSTGASKVVKPADWMLLASVNGTFGII